ncbi:hypothetical protein PSEUBRA_003299 [Kalmanozyma brasiliensis GHG001]|uniref:uncharacterized protein n=1 Tax=Kalmanozyma brasiliensis (strain GHG001) TaxID=1365824 RepID=UPI002868078A|nr:uncharacterized protein PSEUBRA_003299 [Kalmanozyma brasiliensis GHG001]KAF6767219.1 hypothetical protein PSEUBRA_003299 [Kalmanozyma brasiliensis GHG001]
MRPILLFIASILMLSLCTRAVETDAGLDLDVNPDIAEQIAGMAHAQTYAHQIERHASLPSSYFSTVIGWTADGSDRARLRIASGGSRFTLLRDPADPLGHVAYSTFMYQHPRTRVWKRAVMILSLRHGVRGALIGEAHFPAGVSEREAFETWSRLNAEAHWDRRSLLREFGRMALHV